MSAPLTAALDEATLAYIGSIEDRFLRLRRSALILPPVDFKLAAGWHARGIPLELVLATLDEIFARAKDRQPAGRINSLRYCSHAVELAWGAQRELLGPARRGPAPGLAPPPPMSESLEAVAGALPADLPDREAWSGRVRALSESGDPFADLGVLEDALLDTLAAGLDVAETAELCARVEQSLEAAGQQHLTGPGAGARRAELRTRMRRCIVRKLAAVPRLRELLADHQANLWRPPAGEGRETP